MKKLNSYIIESIKSEDQAIIDFLNTVAKVASGYQQALYKEKAKDAESIDVVPISEVFSKEEINEIKKRVRPQPKCCYENAWKLLDRFYYDGHDIKYCEGYMNFKGIPIEHAFNKVDGKYVDITTELALNKPIEDTYILIGEFDIDTVREILIKNGFYGQIYDTIKLDKFKENLKVT